ncbi:hypothetical protein BC829DRAFT_396479 [Chytridium lagenaria]|nr:hypothetical protein BC829DRAFT_396479 [Chytridium lagenaria]
MMGRMKCSAAAAAVVVWLGVSLMGCTAQRTVCIPSSGSLQTGATACITGFTNSTTNLAIFTIHSNQQGWVALSVGATSMSNGDAIIGWTNTTSGTLTQPITTFEYNISPNPSSTFQRIPLIGVKPSWAVISFSVAKPFSGAGNTLARTGANDFVVAWSTRAPSGRDSETTMGFSAHTASPNAFRADLLPLGNGTGVDGGETITVAEPAKPIVEFGILRDNEYTNMVHGVLMFVAWGVAPFIGIFIARFLKNALGVWWFRLHVFFLLIVCGFLTAAGFLVRFLTKTPPHFKSNHEIIGLTVIVAMILQMILGVISDRMWSPDRPSVPWWDKVHWWLGRLTTLLGLANLFLGIDRYNKVTPLNPASNGFFIALAVWIAVWIGVFVYGEVKLGQVHHLKVSDGHEKEG